MLQLIVAPTARSIEQGKQLIPRIREELPKVKQQQELLELRFWLFGLCYVMDWGYKGWNPYVERHLAIFVNCF